MNEVQTDESQCPGSHSYQGWSLGKLQMHALTATTSDDSHTQRSEDSKPREFPQEAGSAAPHPHQRQKRKTKFSVFPDYRATYLALLIGAD